MCLLAQCETKSLGARTHDRFAVASCVSSLYFSVLSPSLRLFARQSTEMKSKSGRSPPPPSAGSFVFLALVLVLMLRGHRVRDDRCSPRPRPSHRPSRLRRSHQHRALLPGPEWKRGKRRVSSRLELTGPFPTCSRLPLLSPLVSPSPSTSSPSVSSPSPSSLSSSSAPTPLSPVPLGLFLFRLAPIQSSSARGTAFSPTSLGGWVVKLV
jgi:hypothetical protein